VKARLYARGKLLGEFELATESLLDPSGKPVPLAPTERVTVAFFEEHPSQPSRPLFMFGALET
jgi:hypothetical protein